MYYCEETNSAYAFWIYDKASYQCNCTLEYQKTTSPSLENLMTTIELIMMTISLIPNAICIHEFRNRDRVKLGHSSSAIGSVVQARSVHRSKSSTNLSFLLLCICDLMMASGLSFANLLNLIVFDKKTEIWRNELNHQAIIGHAHFMAFLMNFNSGIVCCKNWTVVLIVLTRAEVLFYPLQRGSGLDFLRRRSIFQRVVWIAYFLLMSMTYLRAFEAYYIMCRVFKKAGYILVYQIHTMLPRVSDVYFVIQGMIPCVLITVLAVAISHQFRKDQKTYQTNFSSQQQLASLKARQKTNENATKAIIIVAVVFSVTQMPSMILTVLNWLKVDYPKYLLFLANQMKAIAMILNFFVFGSAFAQFKNKYFCFRLHR